MRHCYPLTSRRKAMPNNPKGIRLDLSLAVLVRTLNHYSLNAQRLKYMRFVWEDPSWLTLHGGLKLNASIVRLSPQALLYPIQRYCLRPKPMFDLSIFLNLNLILFFTQLKSVSSYCLGPLFVWVLLSCVLSRAIRKPVWYICSLFRDKKTPIIRYLIMIANCCAANLKCWRVS